MAGWIKWVLAAFFVSVSPFVVSKSKAGEELPSNFVWCDCICGNYNPLDYICMVSVPNAHVSRYLSSLTLRAGATISYRSACKNPAACETADALPWRPVASQLPFKGFVAVKLQENHPYGPFPVGTSFKLKGSAYQPLWQQLYLAK